MTANSTDFFRFTGATGAIETEVSEAAPANFTAMPGLVTDANFHIFIGVWNPLSSGTELYASIYGGPSGTIASGIAGPLDLSGAVYLGWDYSSALTGDIAELIAYPRALDWG